MGASVRARIRAAVAIVGRCRRERGENKKRERGGEGGEAGCGGTRGNQKTGAHRRRQQSPPERVGRRTLAQKRIKKVTPQDDGGRGRRVSSHRSLHCSPCRHRHRQPLGRLSVLPCPFVCCTFLTYCSSSFFLSSTAVPPSPHSLSFVPPSSWVSCIRGGHPPGGGAAQPSTPSDWRFWRRCLLARPCRPPLLLTPPLMRTSPSTRCRTTRLSSWRTTSPASGCTPTPSLTARALGSSL